VTLAIASAGDIATAPANATPPARSASRRDIPFASPRATRSSRLSETLTPRKTPAVAGSFPAAENFFYVQLALLSVGHVGAPSLNSTSPASDPL
jgi:hypothetical protein